MRLLSRAAVSTVALSLAVSPVLAAPKPAAKPVAKPATAAKVQVVTGPVATYWIDTKTNSGLGGMGAKPSMGDMMTMAMGGGDNTTHTLFLRLSSTTAAPAEATGTHQPPSGLNNGKVLPLYWKSVANKPAETPEEPVQSYEPPKGKILIYWGCGEHAAKGQPVVLDLSKLADPAARTQMLKQMVPAGNLTLDNVRAPLPSTSKGYTEWPTGKSNKTFSGSDSLTGGHAIKASFSSDIAFTLDASQDFLPPVSVTGNDKAASGAVPLTWKPMARAKGFIATAVGGGEDNTVVLWTSAEMQTAWLGVSPEYLTADDIDRLTAKKAVLPGTATGCTVPAEVVKSAPALMYGLTAYGGDTNLSWPPRPEDVNTPWNIQWQTKVRYRSTTGGLLGQDFGAGSDNGSDNSATGDKAKKKKGGMFGEMLKQGLGGL